MEIEHRSCLRCHRLEILQSLEAGDIVDYLHEDEILSPSDCELVLGGRTSKERSRTLLDIMPKRGPNAFYSFIRALHSAKYEYLRDSLVSANYDTIKRVDAYKTASDTMERKVKIKSFESLIKDYPYYNAILDDVEPNDILDFLYQEYALSEDECEDIRQCSTRKNRCISMLKKLSMKCSNVSLIVSEALRKSKYSFILHEHSNSYLKKVSDDSKDDFYIDCRKTFLSTKNSTNSGRSEQHGSRCKMKTKVYDLDTDDIKSYRSKIDRRKKILNQVLHNKSKRASVEKGNKYSELEAEVSDRLKHAAGSSFGVIKSSTDSPLENKKNLLVAFNFLSTLVNQGKFSAFENCSTRLEDIYRSDFDLQCTLLYLRASRELFRTNSDTAKTHIKAALCNIPKTSFPVYFTVEILSAKSRMYLNERKFQKFQRTVDEAKMLIESFPTYCVGHAAGWLYLNDARYTMNQIDCINFRKSSAISAFKCLVSKAEHSLIKSIEYFKRDNGEDGPFGLGYALCRMAVLLLQCGANGRLMNILRPSLAEIESAGKCIRTLEGMEADVPKMLKMHINLAKCDLNFRINKIDSAVKFANAAEEFSEKLEMLEFSEHANNRLSRLKQCPTTC